MRLTGLLYKRIKHDYLPFFKRKQWKEKGSHMVVDRFRVPISVIFDTKSHELAELSEDMLTSRHYEEALAREIEIGVTPEIAKELEMLREARIKSYISPEADCRQQPIDSLPTLKYESSRIFTKGLAQACLLANASLRTSPPPGLEWLHAKLRDTCALPTPGVTFDLQSAVEQSLLHAHVWHTDETLLPRRYRAKSRIWKHKTEYGIHPVKTARYLLNNLFRLCQLQSLRLGLAPPSLQSGLPRRWLLRDRLLETAYFWAGDSDCEGRRRIQFSTHSDLVLCSPTPMPCLLEPTPTPEDHSSLERHAAELHLISPLIDLTSTRYYRKESTDGWLSEHALEYPFPHVITVNVGLPNVWSDFNAPEHDIMTVNQRQSIGVMNCLATALATARRQHGDEIVDSSQDLPQPIVVQAIATDGVYFDFITFQLNTLSFPNPTTARAHYSANQKVNFVWIDGNHRLVDKRIPQKSMLRNTLYYDLDMEVFYRIMATYLFGQFRDNADNDLRIIFDDE